MLLLKQMVILFIIMIIGFICKKVRIINDAGSKVISGLVVNVANPALILSASINTETTIQGTDLLITAAIAVVVYIFLIVFAFILPKLLKVPTSQAGCYKLMTIFSNIGFMGFPVISAVYGSDALLYAAIFLFPFNFLIYTYGISVIKKESGEQSKGNVLLKILNVGVIACILTIVIYITRLPIPKPIESVVDSLSNLTAPLSMIVIGASMADMKVKALVTDVRLLIFSAIKLIAIPILGMGIVKLVCMNPSISLDPKLIGVILIMLATPVGSMTAMLSQQYGGDYELASKGVAITTILSVGTMPLVSYIVGLFL